MRKRLLIKHLLETLRLSRGYAVEDSVLRDYVAGVVPPPPTDAEWTGLIELLSGEDKGAITRVPDALDDQLVQWAITDRGRTLLATL